MPTTTSRPVMMRKQLNVRPHHEGVMRGRVGPDILLYFSAISLNPFLTAESQRFSVSLLR